MKKTENVYAVILVGGSGTRFWPLSRQAEPKQFLKIYGGRSFFQQTLSRLRACVAEKNIFIVTNKAYNKKVLQELRGCRIPKANILREPRAKNTAPAICWAAEWIQRRDPSAIMAVFPSDHLILNQKAFARVLAQAVDLARHEYLVTFGIVPKRPETGYGYFKTALVQEGGTSLLRVIKFIEKPSRAHAIRLLKEENYFWNSGMFVWKTSVILQEFKRYQPGIYNFFQNKGTAQIAKMWSRLPAVSIDYGILEKSRKGAAVAASGLHWSDVGSWQSLAEVLPKDFQGNFLKGNTVDIGSQNIFVWGGSRFIATLGLKGVIVVDTPDGLLICQRDCSQKVKDLVEMLKKSKRSKWA